jgi:acetyl esterase/lipase
MKLMMKGRQIGYGATLFVVVGAALTLAQGPIAPQPETISGATSHVYKSVDGIDLRIHVFGPQTLNGSPVPAIVFFFGGAWTNGSVEQFVPQAKYLANRGMVAAVADYRVFGRHRTNAFAAMADARSAIRWMRQHVSELHIDPNRIAAGGGSSGGHVALSAAMIDTFDDPREDHAITAAPNALVLFNPAVDVTIAPAQFAARFDARPQDASPEHHLRQGLPPIIILHGKADATVPYSSVELFCNEAKRLGNDCTLVGYEGAEHGFFNPPNANGKWYRETLHEADTFLTRIGYLPKPPSS